MAGWLSCTRACHAPAWAALDALSLHPRAGFLYWTTVFLRLHNSVCDMLAAETPGMSDQQVGICALSPWQSCCPCA